MEINEQKLQEILALTKENNRMLHKMRRNAFWGGILKLIIWAALIGLPIWLYFTYLFPIMESMMETFEQVQGTGANAQAQFSELQNLLDRFR